MVFYRACDNRLKPFTFAIGCVCNDLLAHARCPKAFEMFGDVFFSLLCIWIGAEKTTYLISHGNEMFGFQAISLCKILSGLL